ncbi:hypothetical protein [Actinoplanes utahensis]|uniref:hypothetical protein n=1 Tax=Actinoplanes utahensis TaxID=1869 RepID=UPI00068A5C4F|nr:hypothetical protein [Actinoplanes utahensis]
MNGVRPIAAVFVLLMLAGCGAPAAPEAPSPSSSSSELLPSGWRWESYGGVQVGVPGEFGWAGRGTRLEAWCVRSDVPDKPPVVARPTVTPAIACGDGEDRLENTGTVVAFGDPPEERDGVEDRGDRTTVRIAGVEVVIQAEKELRRRIAATVHRVRTDAYGCPATHPISAKPDLRPLPATDVATLRDVTALSLCRYELGPSGAFLIAGSRLEGPAAGQALAQIVQAPAGGGPDWPRSCLPEVAYGEEAMVLRTGGSEIFLRYDGCSGHGFDDGVIVRRLSRTGAAPFAGGPHSTSMITAFSTGFVDDKIIPSAGPGK